jgi:hypothetical protein
MSQLSEIVNVVITRETSSVSRAGFGTLMIIGPNVNVNGRLEYFTGSAAALLKIVGVDTVEAALISAIFAQSPTVTRIALGAIMASKTAVIAGTMSAGSISATVNGELVTAPFNTDSDTTLDDLATLIQATDDVATAVNTTGTIVVTPVANTTVGITYDITLATGLTGVTATATELSETYDEALALINAEQPDWYGIAAATRTIAKQQLVATWTEANKKYYIAGSADTNIINQTLAADTTSIAALAKAQSLDRTTAFYSANAATQGPEAALFGKILPLNPGTYTAMFKSLATITVDELTPTQSTNALAKNAGVYQPIGGKNISREGKVGSGEFIDVIIFIDWLNARIGEEVYAQLVKVPKVPFTNPGILSIKSAIDVPLSVGQNRGGISPLAFDDDNVQIGGYVITVPRLQDVTSTDKANRYLQDVLFTAWLAGAIHKVRIDGVVTL